jgi:hypothetical protein
MGSFTPPFDALRAGTQVSPLVGEDLIFVTGGAGGSQRERS